MTSVLAISSTYSVLPQLVTPIYQILDIHAFVVREKSVNEGTDLQDLTVHFFRNKFGLDKMSEGYIAEFVVALKKSITGSLRAHMFVQFARLCSYIGVQADSTLYGTTSWKPYAFYQFLWHSFRRIASRQQLQAAQNGAVEITKDAAMTLLERALSRYFNGEQIGVLHAALLESLRSLEALQLAGGADGEGSAMFDAEQTQNVMLVIPKKAMLVFPPLTAAAGSAPQIVPSNGNGSVPATPIGAASGIMSAIAVAAAAAPSQAAKGKQRAGSERDSLDLDSILLILCRSYNSVIAPLAEACVAAGTAAPEVYATGHVALIEAVTWHIPRSS